jgi:hypothetical protein
VSQRCCYAASAALGVKKGAVWWLRNRDREGDAQVVLQAVQAADCL